MIFISGFQKRKGKRKSGKARGRCERATQHTWSVERESILKSIRHHQHLSHTKCSDLVSIDIECGPQNPYLSLVLYHYGLFEDKHKSMTLHIKINIPDDCPPLPTDATFTLTWDIHAVSKINAEKLESSKDPIKIRFRTGTFYIHNFLLHTVLQQNRREMLEISVHLKTTYSIRENYTTTSTAILSDAPLMISGMYTCTYTTVATYIQ